MWWLYDITDSMDVSFSKLRELVIDREAWRAVVHGVKKSQTWLSNWTELSWRGGLGLYELEVKPERFLNSEPEELEAKVIQTLNYDRCWF